MALLRPALLAVTGAVLAGLPGPPLVAGAIRGRVDVRLEWPALETAPRVGDLGMAQPHDVPDRRRSVVYLEAGPLGAFEDLERRDAFLDQKNEAFYPYVLAVQAGTTVSFPNNDRTYHNVFSLSKAKRFDLGRYPRGQVKTVTFDRPGVVRVFCDIHSHMSAFILVFTHPFFTTSDVDGRYRIPGLPPGTYTLAVWTDGAVRETRKVEVPPGDGAVEADFVVK
jgi:plastocyanin